VHLLLFLLEHAHVREGYGSTRGKTAASEERGMGFKSRADQAIKSPTHCQRLSTDIKVWALKQETEISTARL